MTKKRQKQHIWGAEDTSSASRRPKAKALKAPTFWGVLEEFLFPKSHNFSVKSQINRISLTHMSRTVLDMVGLENKSLRKVFRKIGVINIPLKEGLTKGFRMINFIK